MKNVVVTFGLAPEFDTAFGECFDIGGLEVHVQKTFIFS